MPVQIAPHPRLDPDQPVRISLAPKQPVSNAVFTELQRVADLYSAFVAAGGFDEMSPLSRPTVAIAGASVDVAFAQLPSDPAALGVIGRMLIAVDEWALVSVQGSIAQRPQRALEPLPTSLELVPSVRKALRVKAELEPGMHWYCVELERHGDWSSTELDVLENRAQLWLEVCRAGGLADMSSGDLQITPGNVGMDPPQVGADFWSAQIGATDIHLAAVGSLVNLFDHAARTTAPFDRISIT